MLVHIIGTRPQYVKAAVVVSAMKKAELELLVIDTGQHYDPEMSIKIWENFGMKEPEVLLHVEEKEKNNPVILSKHILHALSDTTVSAILVYGDTNSALAGAWVAEKLNLPLVHIESGLRSFNIEMPEERNRIEIDKLATVLFCSSETGIQNLNKEKIKGKAILTGDVMYDAFLIAQEKAKNIDLENIQPITKNKFSILTIHRPQNTEDPIKLQHILDAMEACPYPVLWPIHPRIKNVPALINGRKNIHPLPPQDYFAMQALLHQCSLVCTDSGGLQKEAYWAKKPCITLREDTEWIETLHNNWNVLAGADSEKIKKAFTAFHDEESWKPLYIGNPTAIITQAIQTFEAAGYPKIN